jgi:hypothetical protein
VVSQSFHVGFGIIANNLVSTATFSTARALHRETDEMKRSDIEPAARSGQNNSSGGHFFTGKQLGRAPPLTNWHDCSHFFEIDRIVAQIRCSQQLHLTQSKERRRNPLPVSQNDLELYARWFHRIISSHDPETLEVSPFEDDQAVALKNPNPLRLPVRSQEPAVVDTYTGQHDLRSSAVGDLEVRGSRAASRQQKY